MISRRRMKATFALSLLSNPGLGDREASGVRSGVVDLFPKDENRETEVSGFRFFVFVISTGCCLYKVLSNDFVCF